MTPPTTISTREEGSSIFTCNVATYLTNYTEQCTIVPPSAPAISFTIFYSFTITHYPRSMFCLHFTKSSTSCIFNFQNTSRGWRRRVARTVKKGGKNFLLLRRGQELRLLVTRIQADNININPGCRVVKLWPGFDWLHSYKLTAEPQESSDYIIF